MALKPYRTLLKEAEDSFIVNKSRFIGSGCPCETEEEALAFLASIRQRYRDASHHCYSYIIGANMGIMRYSDDGEPAGTAGMPIIEVLKNRGVTNCCVVVTRYFGGVLLGAGGLTRAYAQSSSIAVNACGTGMVSPTARYWMDVPYPQLSRVEHFLKAEPVVVEEKTFSADVTLTLSIRTSDEDAFLAKLTDLSEGRMEPLRVEEYYRAWPEDET